MSKQIFLSTEKKREIARTFKVSRQTVWYALTFRTKSSVADMLRAAAMQRGGILLNCDGGFEPNLKFDTYFNDAPHQMVQVFSPRVKMIADLENGSVNIEVDGQVSKTFGDIPMNQIPLVQAEAQQIVNTLK